MNIVSFIKSLDRDILKMVFPYFAMAFIGMAVEWIGAFCNISTAVDMGCGVALTGCIAGLIRTSQFGKEIEDY